MDENSQPSLKITDEQKQYLDKKGIISADQLRDAYKRSVQSQKKIAEMAAEIRKEFGQQ